MFVQTLLRMQFILHFLVKQVQCRVKRKRKKETGVKPVCEAKQHKFEPSISTSAHEFLKDYCLLGWNLQNEIDLESLNSLNKHFFACGCRQSSFQLRKEVIYLLTINARKFEKCASNIFLQTVHKRFQKIKRKYSNAK